jgi:hypothetical protein
LFPFCPQLMIEGLTGQLTLIGRAGVVSDQAERLVTGDRIVPVIRDPSQSVQDTSVGRSSLHWRSGDGRGQFVTLGFRV